MKRKMMVSAVLLAMLLLSDYAGASVYASETKTPKTAKAQETEVQTEEETKEEEVLTAEELAQYYKDSVFVGDSIMVGFRNYCMKKEDESFVKGIQFLAVGSYSAFNAAKPVTNDNVHPLYKGKKYQLWDAIPLMKAKRVFILLGMNDISILGLEGARDQYKEVIDKIVEACPDVEIHILSTTYTLKGKGQKTLNNENLAKYNELLQEMAEENGWNYMDIATPISDGKGNLAEEYCSDDFVHLSSAAYDIWETELREYANARQREAEAETEEKVLDAKTGKDAKTESKTGTVTDKLSTEKTTKEQENAHSKY